MKIDIDWEKKLAPEQYRVLRQHGTERAGSSELNHEKRAGQYVCAGCDEGLFDSRTKYDSGSGWPSFYSAIQSAVATTTDNSLGMSREELHCVNCGGHLGHVFPDGPKPTGLRYCVNGASLKFIPER